MTSLGEHKDPKTSISQKLRAGVYKLKMKENVRSPIWSVFALITDAKSGRTVVDFMCCSGCGKLFKYAGALTSNIYMHSCYLEFKIRNTNCQDGSKPESENDTNSEVDDSVEREDPLKSIWNTFSLSVNYGEDITNAVIRCIYCSQVIDYSKTELPDTHKCLNGNERYVI